LGLDLPERKAGTPMVPNTSAWYTKAGVAAKSPARIALRQGYFDARSALLVSWVLTPQLRCTPSRTTRHLSKAHGAGNPAIDPGQAYRSGSVFGWMPETEAAQKPDHAHPHTKRHPSPWQCDLTWCCRESKSEPVWSPFSRSRGREKRRKPGSGF
jgi:hypothetical protein